MGKWWVERAGRTCMRLLRVSSLKWSASSVTRPGQNVCGHERLGWPDGALPGVRPCMCVCVGEIEGERESPIAINVSKPAHPARHPQHDRV